MPESHKVRPLGAFDLQQSADFGFGQRDAIAGSAEMRMAFVLDGYAEHAAVHVTQEPDGMVAMTVSGTTDASAAIAQASRALSLDVDARGWDQLGRTDPLIGRLQAARPGLRPPLFYSAYEAAAWVALSARRPRQQMAVVRDKLSRQHGVVFDVAGESVAAFPTPERLLGVREFAGLPAAKLQRLHGVAEAALAGDLDTATLQAMPPDEAAARVRQLNGVGPFYAELIVIRALGNTDVAPTVEPQVLAIAGNLLGNGEPLTPEEFQQATVRWTPWRTWASVALRAAGPMLIDGA
jgi:DNA-3-methyladenine glycosylase II